MNPIKKFQKWYEKEVKKSLVRVPSACCLTSIGIDGYPNSRFVSLKEIIDDKFVITGPLNSRKGRELLKNPKTSLTFWWPETEKQVRIQGMAKQIESKLADKYFNARHKDSQLVSMLSNQGKVIDDLKVLIGEFENKKYGSAPLKINRPNDWSGFYIIPKRIELMKFKKSRFHIRELYELEDNLWKKIMLQP